MIKQITITLLLAISMASCVITTENNEIIILNNTENIIEADIYNTWTGNTETSWKLQKGINKLNLSNNNLYGLYAKGYPEQTIYAHTNASLTFNKDELILDEINQEVNAHVIWSQQIITGESQSIFHWHISKNKLRAISDWETFDSILFKLIEDPEFKVKKGILNSNFLNSYPAAYILIDKICENDFISIAAKMKYVHTKLLETGINENTQNNFLEHYLTPQSLSLRNDSIILLTKEYFPEIANNLSSKYLQLKEDAKLNTGMQFPDFSYNNETIKSADLTKGFEYTLIDFWATWCIPCIKQMPDMNQYAIDYKNKIQFVSISVDNERDYNKWLDISNQYNAIKHLWVSDSTTIREEMGVKGLPRMILLDKTGKIVDPNFPHLYDPLAKQWIKSLAKRSTKKIAEKH